MKLTRRRLLVLTILAAGLCLFGAASAAAEDVPGPVSELGATSENGSITVDWRAPSIGGAPNRYIVHLKPVDGGRGKTRRPKASRTEITFNNLKLGTTYRIRAMGQLCPDSTGNRHPPRPSAPRSLTGYPTGRV